MAGSGSVQADTVKLLAGGSPCAALTELARASEAESGTAVEAAFGVSGLLRDRIG